MVEYQDLKLSEDLVSLAQQYRAFLQDLYPYVKENFQGEFIKNAVRRYETCWLPLKKKHQEVEVLPPRDVYWVWHVHMLCPHQYVMDCENLIGCVPDHAFTDSQEARTRGQQLWTEMNKGESYDVSDLKTSNFQSKCEAQLEKLAEQEVDYFYNVALPHMGNTIFLTDAMYRYQKFLWLKMNDSDLDLIPVFDIDLVWRSHMMRPVAYGKDCESIFGEVLVYDCMDSAHVPDSRDLNRDPMAVVKTWRRHFEEEFFIPGTKRRGEDLAYCLTNIPAKDWNAITCGKPSVT